MLFSVLNTFIEEIIDIATTSCIFIYIFNFGQSVIDNFKKFTVLAKQKPKLQNIVTCVNFNDNVYIYIYIKI